MARCTARRRGILGCSSSKEDSEVRDDRDVESERELKEEVEGEDEQRDDVGDGEAGGDGASERMSLGIEPNMACCCGVK
jgi:hypothetical protein